MFRCANAKDGKPMPDRAPSDQPTKGCGAPHIPNAWCSGAPSDEEEVRGEPKKKRDPRFQKVDGTHWTVDVDGEIQWQLRYGDPASVRMLAASLAAQFAHLADPTRPLKDCQNALRRARHAVANAHVEVHAYD
jgi:hypothetical protein